MAVTEAELHSRGSRCTPGPLRTRFSRAAADRVSFVCEADR